MLEPADARPSISSSHPPRAPEASPRGLDRRPDAEVYESHGIENLPESGHLWYTDGGLLGAQPLGRVIAAGRALHGDEDGFTGVHLSSTRVPRTPRWTGGAIPTPSRAGRPAPRGALAILSEQSLFDDMRRIEKDNSRIEWAERLADRLGEKLDDEAASSLREFIAEVGPRARKCAPTSAPAATTTQTKRTAIPTELLRRALGEIAGLVGEGASRST